MPKIKLGRALRISFNKSSVRMHLKIFPWLNFFTMLVLMPQVNTMGIISRCVGDRFRKHVLFMDFDDVHESVVRGDVEFVQREYDAGTAVILRSGELDCNTAGEFYGNFHVICPQKFTFREVIEIISHLHTDENFATIATHFNYRAFVLRVYPKYSENGRMLKDRPVLHDVMWSQTGRETYQALYEFLMKYYLMPAWEGLLAPRSDGLKVLGIIKYQTTEGFRVAFQKRIKSSLQNIKMHFNLFGGVHANSNKRS